MIKTTEELRVQLEGHDEDAIRKQLEADDSLFYNATQDKFYIINDENFFEEKQSNWNFVFSDDQIYGLTQSRRIAKEILLQSAASGKVFKIDASI